MKRKVEGKIPSAKRSKMDNSKEEIWKELRVAFDNSKEETWKELAKKAIYVFQLPDVVITYVTCRLGLKIKDIKDGSGSRYIGIDKGENGKKFPSAVEFCFHEINKKTFMTYYPQSTFFNFDYLERWKNEWGFKESVNMDSSNIYELFKM